MLEVFQALYLSLFPRMKSSTQFLAMSSLTWVGGCLKAYEEMLVRGPDTPLSRASLTARMTSITTPPLLGESLTMSLASTVMGSETHRRAKAGLPGRGLGQRT